MRSPGGLPIAHTMILFVMESDEMSLAKNSLSVIYDMRTNETV